MTWYVFFQFLHVLAAILAFGTGMLAFPFIGAFAQKEPAHVNFALRLNYALGRRAVTPLAVLTFVLGIVLVIVGDWDLSDNEWLVISIVLLVLTIGNAQLHTLPCVGRLVSVTASMPADRSAGPSPEVAKLVREVRIGGAVNALMLATITLLMVWKPGA
jgi:uncharacterized membrane protein